MSLLKKIFGGKSWESLRAEADALHASGDFGAAKLAYERAKDAAPEASRAELAERVDASRDAIAKQRTERAAELVTNGEIDLAREELEGAIDTAASAEVRTAAEQVLYSLERREAVAAATHVEPTDEDRLAAIAGSWEDEQDEEYASYGDVMTEALLALYGGRAEAARAELEKVLDGAEAPRYLWLEVGRARLVTDDDAGGEQALRTFLELLEDDEGGAARVSAHVELARIADAKGDVDGAIAELEGAAAFLDDDPRPLLELGRYLRSKKRAAEAVEVLEMAADLLNDLRPDVGVLEELGLAHADTGADERAIETFESVISLLTARQHLDFPVRTTVTLARLHEKAGRLERAADLWSALSRGSDRDNHALYHREAARLLEELGLTNEARRMLERATALDAGREAPPSEGSP